MTQTLRWIGTLMAIGVTAFGLAAESEKETNTLSSEEKSGGWQLLFDGKTTAGWRKYGGGDVPAKWSVKDGALVFDPRAAGEGGDIVTTGAYDSFELAIEWRISPGGNSGIMYRVAEGPAEPWRTGPEYQVLDNARHPDGRNKLTSAASCYGLYAPTKDATRPVGEWNQARIIIDGQHVEHWLNGVKVVAYDLGSDEWEQRVKKSKFRSMPRYGREARGHIDLQDHGDPVAYRNIKLRPLGANSGR